ncbi:DNA-binding protein [Thiomicrospira aerophila AL3]|uniref:DNA-binding protein n=1 Tax=Thiomicrospira aerophila AL3 TaxID=717772 RepID=W0DUP0_9GAMM|nr:helix-turn-helix transcriptional regulator [Thiomicrospira aerophila]AHF00684.1 DNA-binding protein [Thiomicrospira aerophila AL3]
MAKPPICKIDQALGKRIQLRRKELGCSAEKLSESIGVSQQQFSRYERGNSKLTASQLINIAHATDTPIGWFSLDIPPDKPFSLIAENNNQYQSFASRELFSRIEQVWPSLSIDQQRAVISVIDAFKLK